MSIKWCSKSSGKQHMGRVAEMGCVICGGQAQVHHVRLPGITGMGQRASNWLTIALCEKHHTGSLGFHKMGREQWEAIFGPQMAHWEYTMKILYEES